MAVGLRFFSQRKFAAALAVVALLIAGAPRAFPQLSETAGENTVSETREDAELDQWYEAVRNEIVDRYEAAAEAPPIPVAHPFATWFAPALTVISSGIVSTTAAALAAQKKTCSPGRLGCGNVLSPSQ